MVLRKPKSCGEDDADLQISLSHIKSFETKELVGNGQDMSEQSRGIHHGGPKIASSHSSTAATSCG